MRRKERTTDMEGTELSAVWQEAMQLHSNIMAARGAAASALVDSCRMLKEMRDKKLYTALGFEDFGAYAEQMAGIKQRQAYNYIKVYEQLSPKLIAENAQAGVTKLLLLTQVSELDRDEFAAEHDLEGMSVKEIEALIKEKNGMHEQLSMLENDLNAADAAREKADAEAERLREEAEELRKRLEEIRREPVDVPPAPDENAIRESVRRELEAEHKAALEAERVNSQKQLDKAVRDARAEEREKAKKKADKTAKAAVEQALAEAREQIEAEHREDLEKEHALVEQAEARAKELEKRLQIAGNKDTVRFALLFEQAQRTINEALALVQEIRQNGGEETADKLLRAMHQMLAQAQTLTLTEG